MDNSHGSKFLVYIGAALLLMTAGVFCIVYGCLGEHQHKDWLFWTIVAAININTSILLLVSATVHKVKADLLRRRSRSKSE